jgi:hypothetical protein
MPIFGGFLLYIGTLTMLLAAAAIAAGTLLSDPEGNPAASAVAAQAAPPALVRKDGKAAKKPKEGVQDVAKLHPVAPPASAISVRPSVDRAAKTNGRQKKRTAKKKDRPTIARPQQADPAPSLGYAATDARWPLFFPYRR